MKIVETPLYNDLQTPGVVAHDEHAVNNAIRNILSTIKGTVPGRPEYGSNLYQLVFEPIDAASIVFMKKVIAETVYKWEKRITILSIDIDVNPEYNRVLAMIYYKFNDDALNTEHEATVNLRG